MSKLTAILAGCVAASLVSLGAQAFSPAPIPTRATAPEITPVADYCGPALLGVPYGGCQPNAAPAVLGLPYVGPPVVVLPWLGPAEVVWPPACPYGYTYVIHSGRCVLL
jgi:hypothetical protein